MGPKCTLVKNLKKPKSAINGRLGGRPKGSVNKATATIREMARKYAPEALQELGRLALSADSEAAKVAAIKEILDRAYGKSPQPLDGDGEGSPVRVEIGWLNRDA